MSEVNIKLGGWQAIVVIVAFLGVIALRLATLSDQKDDQDLMKHIHTQLLMEYAPHVAEKLRSALDAGDKGRVEEAVESVTSTRVNVRSVRASYPVFDFSTPRDVVIKVVFSLDDASGSGEERTVYYLFRQGAFGWQFRHETTAMRYYSNFI